MRIPTSANLLYGAIVVFFSVCMLVQCNKNPSDAQRPFIVSAGPDSTVALNKYVNLAGSASEGGVPDTAFVFSWKQIAGPDSAQIFSPSTKITRIQFDQTGIYRISITVSDGTKEKSDTVVYTVLDSVPFVVLKPAAGDRIVIGDSTLIKWQIVTPLPQTMIDVSVDKGKTWTTLTTTSVLINTQWVWHVDPNTQPCDSCLVQIRNYNNSSNVVKSEYFSLVTQ